jgi:hypothetical protein
MFKLRQFLHRPKFDAAKQSGMNLEAMHEEQAHNMCELTDKNEMTWNAGINL